VCRRPISETGKISVSAHRNHRLPEFELRIGIVKAELHLGARVAPLRRQIVRPIREDLHQRALE